MTRPSGNRAASPRAGRTAIGGGALRALACALGLGVSLLAAVPPASAAEFQIVQSGQQNRVLLLMQGPILGGETQKLQALMERIPSTKSVAIFLESPGGNLGEGLRLGAYFHQHRITTIAKGSGSVCASACALAFLGGRDKRTGKPLRIKSSAARLGFHQFRRAAYDPLKVYTKTDFEHEVKHAQATTRSIVMYLKHIGEDLSKLKLMLRKPSEEMYFVSNEESLTVGFHVLNEADGRITDPSSSVGRKAGS